MTSGNDKTPGARGEPGLDVGEEGLAAGVGRFQRYVQRHESGVVHVSPDVPDKTFQARRGQTGQETSDGCRHDSVERAPVNEERDQGHAQIQRQGVMQRPQHEAPRQLGENQGDAQKDHEAGREHRVTRDDAAGSVA
jgi:hypothetical protein